MTIDCRAARALLSSLMVFAVADHGAGFDGHADHGGTAPAFDGRIGRFRQMDPDGVVRSGGVRAHPQITMGVGFGF